MRRISRKHPDKVGCAVPMVELERDYWDIVETGQPSTTVDYSNDLDTSLYGSGFPKVNIVVRATFMGEIIFDDRTVLLSQMIMSELSLRIVMTCFPPHTMKDVVGIFRTCPI